MSSLAMRFGLALVVIFRLSACEYRETLGRTTETGVCDGSSCTPRNCSSFEVPSSDCTLGQGACDFASDCAGSNRSCNLMTRRCFAATDDCVGTPCGFDQDCPSSERCNQTAGICYEFNADQTCMPCFLSSTDCGRQACDSSIDQCR